MNQTFEKRSNAVVVYIHAFEMAHGFPPAGEDIARGCGISPSYAYALLTRMEEEGLIERGRIDGRQIGRNIRLTKAAMKALEENL